MAVLTANVPMVWSSADSCGSCGTDAFTGLKTKKAPRHLLMDASLRALTATTVKFSPLKMSATNVGAIKVKLFALLRMNVRMR